MSDKKKLKFYEWLLTEPKAFQVIIFYGNIIAMILFVGLFILSLVYDFNIIAKVIVGIFAMITINKAYKVYRLSKTGIYNEMTIAELNNLTVVKENEQEKKEVE